MRHSLALALVFVLSPLEAQVCSNTSTGNVPLPQLTSYLGYPGGLYPGGLNAPPPAHLAKGLAEAALVVPRDAAGAPDPTGRIVLLSIGMSNATQEFSAWMPWSAADGDRNPSLVVVDGAQGGQDAQVFSNPAAPAWTVVDARIAAAGASNAQVQAVWIKEASANPTPGFPAHVNELKGWLRAIAQNLRARFPNLRVAYLSSRTYGGYATNPLRGEPLTYESAFAVQQMIAEQIAGDPALNCDASLGPVQAPWLAWGPYLWADGLVPRADGLVWECADYQNDGIHPANFGRYKVLQMLDAFFRAEPTAANWYLGGPGVPIGAALPIGAGCPGGNGLVTIQVNHVPTIGDPTFTVGATRFTPGTFATLAMGMGIERYELVRGCDLYLDLAGLWPLPPVLVVNGVGNAFFPLPIPADPFLVGVRFHAQWVSLDPTGPIFAPLGLPLRFSPALELRVGP